MRPFLGFNLGGAYPSKVMPDEAEDFITAWKSYRASQREDFPQAELVHGGISTPSGAGLDWHTTRPEAAQADILGVVSYNRWPR